MAKARRTRKRVPRESRKLVSVGQHGATVTIVPRDGHPTQAQARWLHPTTRRRQRRTIPGFELPSPGTALPKAKKTVLQNLASILNQRLVNGLPMPGDAGGPAWEALIAKATPQKPQVGDETPEAELTVRDALAVAFGPSYADRVNSNQRISGRFVRTIKGKPSGGLAISTWTDHARDLRRLADVVERHLGPNNPWSWSEATYTELRDALIAEVVATTSQTEAPEKLRRVHKTLQTYIRATRLVQKAFQDRDDIKSRPKALILDRWLVDLKEAWTAAKLLPPEEEQPRYTTVEAGLIYREGTSGRHDPRYALWLLLAMEGRPVQVLRARRSHLVDDYQDTPRGIFRGPGTRLKHGLVYAPTPAHRVAIDQHLHGYLRDYERRYQRREIADYPLFPSGHLVNGVAPFRENPRLLGYRQFLGAPASKTGYYAIEAAAKVSNVPGRGPYALKYTIADIAPLAAGRLGVGDAVAINLVTAHDTPGTATQYRRRVRTQPAMLVTVGRIIWEIRKDLLELGDIGHTEKALGIPTEPDSIRHFLLQEDGIRIRTMRGLNLWVPWKAVIRHAKPPRGSVEDYLATAPRLRRRVTVDDQASELRFQYFTVRLQTMLDVALRSGPKAAHDPRVEDEE